MLTIRALAIGLLCVAAMATSGGALPETCLDPCTVFAATPGFVSPVVTIDSGSDVVFESLDVTHPTGEALNGQDSCFIASTFGGMPSDPVTFTWENQVLRANGVACDSAGMLSTGEGFLMFQCLLHPNMVGTLVVT